MHHLPACSRYCLHAPMPVLLKVTVADCATLRLPTGDCLNGCLIMHCLHKAVYCSSAVATAYTMKHVLYSRLRHLHAYTNISWHRHTGMLCSPGGACCVNASLTLCTDAPSLEHMLCTASKHTHIDLSCTYPAFIMSWKANLSLLLLLFRHTHMFCVYPGGSCSYDSTTVTLSVLCYVPNTAPLVELQASYLQPAIRRQLSALQHKIVQQGSLQPWTVFQVLLSCTQCAF